MRQRGVNDTSTLSGAGRTLPVLVRKVKFSRLDIRCLANYDVKRSWLTYAPDTVREIWASSFTGNSQWGR